MSNTDCPTHCRVSTDEVVKSGRSYGKHTTLPVASLVIDTEGLEVGTQSWDRRMEAALRAERQRKQAELEQKFPRRVSPAVDSKFDGSIFGTYSDRDKLRD
jgi:hypothetical protein